MNGERLPKGYKSENQSQNGDNPTKENKTVVAIILAIGTILAALAGVVTHDEVMISLFGGVSIVAGLVLYFCVIQRKRFQK